MKSVLAALAVTRMLLLTACGRHANETCTHSHMGFILIYTGKMFLPFPQRICDHWEPNNKQKEAE